MIFEYGMKNKRRLMEDKVAILEDIDIFDGSTPNSKSSRPNAIFGVFDGECPPTGQAGQRAASQTILL